MSWLHPFRTWRRRATSVPFPAPWDEILARRFPLEGRLTPADRAELRARIQIFLAEKRFEGLHGLALTDEIRVTIAAQACMLLLHRGEESYPGLCSILVYPAAYRALAVHRSEGGLVTEGEQVRLGESWSTGSLVLSWDDVVRGAADEHDGHNVVLHEFAHQLDAADRRGDGAPLLESRGAYAAWARVLGREYARLQDDIAHHHRSVMDAYGATSPAEFFAVATETFFEKPVALRERHPELYEQLRGFYRQDPVVWFQHPRLPS